MPGIIFPMSGSVFRMIFFIRKYSLSLNYFPNEPFFLPNDIFRLPNVFYSRKLSLSPIFIIHPDTRTTISGSQKQKKQTSTTASGSAVAFPFTRAIKLGNEKLTEVTFLH